MNNTIRLQTLTFSDAKTYLTATLFVLGNIVMPQLFHTIPHGGAVWLPIYFFTLIGAYIYGWRVGLLTALASPVINSLLFGMPAAAVLPAIMLKSVLLALIAGAVAARFGKVTFGLLLLTVAGYQLLGTAGEWMICGDLRLACQDLRLGVPGMLLQIVGGLALIRLLSRRRG